MNISSIIANHTHPQVDPPKEDAQTILDREERDSLSRYNWLQHALTKDLVIELEYRQQELIKEACCNAKYVGDAAQQTRLLVAAQTITETLTVIKGITK